MKKYELENIKNTNDEEKQYVLVAQSYAIDIDKVETRIVENIDEYNELDEAIEIIDRRLNLLENKSDNIDYAVAAASGLLCGLMDTFFIGEMDLTKLKDASDENVKNYVLKYAKKHGWNGKEDDITSAVRFLEKKFTLASDPNEMIFGGTRKHHFNDFSHHPSIIGYIFSLITQFTKKAMGIDNYGMFVIEDIKNSKLIGKTVPEKISLGTLAWFGHLVSDMAGSSSTAATTGGTGIPGPIMSLAKEISALPFVKSNPNFLDDIIMGKSSLNIKMDLRGEIALYKFLEKQALPVIANDSIVRAFYLIRRLSKEIKENDNVHSIKDLSLIDKSKYMPFNNKTIQTMLTISSGVFTTIDLTDAVIRNGAHFYLRINYPGVAKFAIDITINVKMTREKRTLEELREIFIGLKANKYYKKEFVEKDFINDLSSLGLSMSPEELYILHNIKYQLLLNDTVIKNGNLQKKESEFLREYQKLVEKTYIDMYHIEEFKWLSIEDINERIIQNKLSTNAKACILLNCVAMYPYEISDSNGKNALRFKQKNADKFLEFYFENNLLGEGSVKRFRDTIVSLDKKLSGETAKKIGMGAIGGIALGGLAVAFAPGIAVTLVGSNFALSGAALTSASLSSIGGGSLAAGGLGMAGGTVIIGAGGSLLGMSAGALNVTANDYKKSFVDTVKLLTYIKEVYVKEYSDRSHIKAIYNVINERELPVLKEFKDSKIIEEKAQKKLLELNNDEKGKIEKIKDQFNKLKKKSKITSHEKKKLEIKNEIKKLDETIENISKIEKLLKKESSILKELFNDNLREEYLSKELH